jgi:ankyrin repeat protein
MRVMTPLHWASLNGHMEVVKALLAAEAEVDKANNEGGLHCTGPPIMGTWRW